MVAVGPGNEQHPDLLKHAWAADQRPEPAYVSTLNNRGDVVWVQNGQVYGLLSGQLTQLTIASSGHNPSINDFGEVVWSQLDPATGRLQIYSTTRGYLTTDENEHLNPSINNQGDVVWEQIDPMDGFSKIYGVIGGVPSQITNKPAMQPSISNSGEVVWVDSLDERIYSSTRGQVTHDCPFGRGHSEPSVNSCGDLTFSNLGNDLRSLIYRLGSNSPCATEPEPNNSREQAIAVGGNSSTTGSLDATADVEDWYSFTANAGEQIKVNINRTATPPNLLTVELVDSYGQVLMSSGLVNPIKWDTELPLTGTYYVHLFTSAGRLGYNLSVEVGPGTGACAVPVSPGYEQQTGSSINDLGEMVWSQWDPATNNTQIYSSVRGQLTSDFNPHTSPSLNNRGDVVWEQNGQVSGLYSQLMPMHMGVNSGQQPSINDFGEVVWSQFDQATGRTQIYSITRGYLTNDQSEHTNPSINNQGDLVWEQTDPMGQYNQIYGIIGGVPSQLTNDPGWHGQPSISNSGEVVWVDCLFQ